MEYRFLGSSGLKVSALSLGAWVTYGSQVGQEVAYECMTAAYDRGVNFFDNAEAYASGEAEVVTQAIIALAQGAALQSIVDPEGFDVQAYFRLVDRALADFLDAQWT